MTFFATKSRIPATFSFRTIRGNGSGAPNLSIYSWYRGPTGGDYFYTVSVDYESWPVNSFAMSVSCITTLEFPPGVFVQGGFYGNEYPPGSYLFSGNSTGVGSNNAHNQGNYVNVTNRGMLSMLNSTNYYLNPTQFAIENNLLYIDFYVNIAAAKIPFGSSVGGSVSPTGDAFTPPGPPTYYGDAVPINDFKVKTDFSASGTSFVVDPGKNWSLYKFRLDVVTMTAGPVTILL